MKHAPTHFGNVDYEIASDVNHGKISANVELPPRYPVREIWLRLRHPTSAPMKNVTVNGKDWKDFDQRRKSSSCTTSRSTSTSKSITNRIRRDLADRLAGCFRGFVIRGADDANAEPGRQPLQIGVVMSFAGSKGKIDFRSAGCDDGGEWEPPKNKPR